MNEKTSNQKQPDNTAELLQFHAIKKRRWSPNLEIHKLTMNIKFYSSMKYKIFTTLGKIEMYVYATFLCIKYADPHLILWHLLKIKI